MSSYRTAPSSRFETSRPSFVCFSGRLFLSSLWSGLCPKTSQSSLLLSSLLPLRLAFHLFLIADSVSTWATRHAASLSAVAVLLNLSYDPCAICLVFRPETIHRNSQDGFHLFYFPSICFLSAGYMNKTSPNWIHQVNDITVSREDSWLPEKESRCETSFSPLPFWLQSFIRGCRERDWSHLASGARADVQVSNTISIIQP